MAPGAELVWAIQRIEQSRSIHLAWVDHLRAHQEGGVACDRCPPDIGHSVGDVEHHLWVAADYERVIKVLKARMPEVGPDQRSLLQAAADALRSYQFGNSSPELAKGIAGLIETALKEDGAAMAQADGDGW